MIAYIYGLRSVKHQHPCDNLAHLFLQIFVSASSIKDTDFPHPPDTCSTSFSCIEGDLKFMSSYNYQYFLYIIWHSCHG